MGSINEDLNRSSVEILLTDADVALTFLGVADTTSIEENRLRQIGEAHQAYESILKFHRRLNLSPDEDTLLAGKMTLIRSRLARAGVTVSE